MDEIAELLEQAADRLGPHAFDVEAMVAATRLARRRRRGLQVAGSALGAVAVLGLSVSALAGLGGHHTAAPAEGTSTAAVATRPAAVTVAPVVTFRTTPPSLHRPPIPVLPKGFAPACGKPGTKLMVRIVPVTIPYRICDLSGVEIDRPGRISAVVPPRGQVVAVVVDGVAGAKPPPQGLSIRTDKNTGDVTIASP